MEQAPGPLILCLEDEALVLDLTATSLEDAGFAVLPVTSPDQALRMLEARETEIRALVTDVDLGYALSGWDVARKARERLPHLPVIYTSGGSAADWTAGGVPNSVMLAKPYAFAQLVVAISTALQHADQAGEPG